ncbi:MAG: hypothetical protein ACRDIF_03085, partial [Actinomycetota bacterium]
MTAAQVETGGLERWLHHVRRRVRIRMGVRWTVTALVAWGAGSALVLAIARGVPLGWERTAALAALPLLLVAGFAAGAVRRLPLALVARAADKELAGADRLATAVDVSVRPWRFDLGPAQVRQAGRWAQG